MIFLTINEKQYAVEVGIGEPGLPPIVPALANAVYNAAKVRIRNLPMTPESVLRSMKV